MREGEREKETRETQKEREKQREELERESVCVLSERVRVTQWQTEQYTCKIFTNLSGYIYWRKRARETDRDRKSESCAI